MGGRNAGMNIWAALLKFRNPPDKRSTPIRQKTKVTTLRPLPPVRDRLRNRIIKSMVKHVFSQNVFERHFSLFELLNFRIQLSCFNFYGVV